MKFIQLTENNPSLSKQEILINIQCIESIQPRLQETAIRCTSDRIYLVKESVDEIIGMINNES